VISLVYSVRHTPEARLLIKTLHANPPTLNTLAVSVMPGRSDGRRAKRRLKVYWKEFIASRNKGCINQRYVNIASMSPTMSARHSAVVEANREPSCARRRQRPFLGALRPLPNAIGWWGGGSRAHRARAAIDRVRRYFLLGSARAAE
jgi:hypothetical protein